MSAKELRGKESAALQGELIKLRREQFSLRMQSASGQAVKPSDFSKVKKSTSTPRSPRVLSSARSSAARWTRPSL
jgi:large subunit ribosomal protein L29